MTKRRETSAKTSAAIPPAGWENADSRSFDAMARAYPDWFMALAKKVRDEFAWRPGAAGASPGQKHTSHVIKSGQLEYLRSKVAAQEECLEAAGIKDSISPSLLKLIEADIAKQRNQERKQPKFGGYFTAAHDWLAEQHAGPELRLALGYKVSAFQSLRHAARVAAGPKGLQREFTFAETLRLLRTRLARNRPNANTRREIADEIWDNVKHGLFQVQRLASLRKVLLTTGAKCEPLPRLEPTGPSPADCLGAAPR